MANFKVNCIYNDDGAWCKNPLVKRCFFGFGARLCCDYGVLGSSKCPHKIEHPHPPVSVPPPRIKNIVKSIHKEEDGK